MYWDQGLIVVLVYYFQILSTKEHNIIICRIIGSQIGTMYFKAPCIINRIISGHMGVKVYCNTL